MGNLVQHSQQHIFNCNLFKAKFGFSLSSKKITAWLHHKILVGELIKYNDMSKTRSSYTCIANWL